MKRFTLLFFCLILIAATGCQREENDVLTTDQMVEILFDIYRFDATVSISDQYVDNESKVRYYNGIFAKHHTDKEHFDEALEWYAAHPDKWRLVYEQLEEKSRIFQEQVENGKLPEFKAHGIECSDVDTLDYWLSKEHMYWYKDDRRAIDSVRISQVIEGRKYFVGTHKMELTFRMRCICDSNISVKTNMIVRYLRGKADTLQVEASANGKWHRYRLATGKVRSGITSIAVCIADSVSASLLSSIEYEDMRLHYIFSTTGEQVNASDRRILTRMQSKRRDRQMDFNIKRDEDGKKDSSEQDRYPQMPVR